MTLHAFGLTKWFKIIHFADNFSGVMAHNLLMVHDKNPLYIVGDNISVWRFISIVFILLTVIVFVAT
jgi:hypothetical protein